MTLKHTPTISKEQHIRYTHISKADLVEAFRDLAREYLGNETNDLEWFAELERRLETIHRERKAQNSLQYSEDQHTSLP